jgi:ABC-2 type transport system permease protein
MRAFASQIRLGLTLAIRNRMALIYGFVFPLMFLMAFWVLYRHDEVPIALHLGELLTVTILGGACFGLPTMLVSERERGVWRRYRLTSTPAWLFIASTLTTRFVLILAAALLQVALALALGMPFPAHPLGLLLSFALTAMAFMGLGLVIAILSDNVPTVQALGQCIFLPMLIIGGVAVRLSALPQWALYVSAFFPGRYAVAALQGTVTGAGLASVGFQLLALTLTGAAASIVGLRLFRWDAARVGTPGRKWVFLALCMWILVGLLAVWRGRVAADVVVENVGPGPDFATARPVAAWQALNAEDFKRVAYERLPPDNGLVAPLAAADEQPEPLVAEQLDRIRIGLATWPPGREADPVQRVRNDLYIAAVADLLQMSDVERFLPRIVLDRLQQDLGAEDLPRILYWVAMHPDEGDDAAVAEMELLGLPAVTGPRKALRGRVMLYAFKFLGRLTGNIPIG